MSDRVELRCQLRAVSCERICEEVEVLTDIKESPAPALPGGVGICYPQAGDTLWSVARRYRVPADALRAANPGVERAEAGRPLLVVRRRRAAGG